ncbi:unnamed protein product, partial [Urochloa humidicola]
CLFAATDDQQDSAECFCTAARTSAERFNTSWDGMKNQLSALQIKMKNNVLRQLVASE